MCTPDISLQVDRMSDASSDGDIPAELIALSRPFPHFINALSGDTAVKVVAMGSSSTAGRGDVVPYPHWLEMYLRVDYAAKRYPNPKIDVLNRGRGGEEAIEELKRFDADIFAERPSLVIWQVGTNAVFHGYDLDQVAETIAHGLELLRAHSMDVLLIDPQYTPAMLFDNKVAASERIVSLIAAAAEKARVNLFRRWALMRHWHIHNDIALDRMFDPTDSDKLHQSDWSTRRVSQALCQAITGAPPVVPDR
jgi:GDSL-like Lipase/Acylhydrolase family